MSQETINERIKFLIERLGMSARGFSMAIGSSDTNTRNYLDRGSKPGSDYLERILNRFEAINGTWLLTGKGEPFLFPPNENSQTTTLTQKNFRNQVVGTNQGLVGDNHGTNTQHNAPSSAPEAEAAKTELAIAKKEIEHLKAQLETKDALIASKEETITLLRASYNRPN